MSLKSTLVAVSLALGATAAHAQGTGTYCSASTTDGLWAFSFGVNPVNYNCARVRNSLITSTRAPIGNWTRGFYWLNGLNQVTAWCFNGSRVYTGFGGAALQQAYNATWTLGGTGCVFSVN